MDNNWINICKSIQLEISRADNFKICESNETELWSMMPKHILNSYPGENFLYLQIGDLLDGEFAITEVLDYLGRLRQTHNFNLKVITVYNSQNDKIYEKYSNFLDVECNNKLYGLYSMYYAYMPSIEEVVNRTYFKKHFLCLNARMLWPRQFLLYWFYKHDLFKSSYFSYLGDTRLAQANQLVFSDLHDILARIQCINEALVNDIDKDTVYNLLPMELDRDPSRNSIRGTWGTMIDYIESSFCSIITETYVIEKYPLLTEKFFRAVSTGHPFLIFGHENIKQEILNLGFKTYDMIFDESYYDIADPYERIIAMGEEINRIAKFDNDTLAELQNKALPTILHNMAVFADLEYQLKESFNLPINTEERMEKKTNFLDAIKAAQAAKTTIPQSKAKQVQEAKFKTQVGSNKPTRRASGRGG